MIGRYTSHGRYSVLFRHVSSQWKVFETKNGNNQHHSTVTASASASAIAHFSPNAVVPGIENRFPEPTTAHPAAETSATSSAQLLEGSSLPPTTVKLHDLLHHGCLPYPQTWAFQQVLLHRRLHQRRRQIQQQDEQSQQQQQVPPSPSARQSSSTPIDDDCDCVVLLEHSPVYTLGRGADEKHLTFVQNAADQSSSSLNNNSTLDEVSQKLSRKVRGPGTARLSLDKNMEAQLQDLNRKKTSDGELPMLRVVEQLTESVSPVIAPNGVPVYRVDRGGEGMYGDCVACVSEFLYIPVYIRAYVCILSSGTDVIDESN